jgi:hypothetical protein
MKKKFVPYAELRKQFRDSFDPMVVFKAVEKDTTIALGYGIPREELHRLLAEACHVIIRERNSVLEAEVLLNRSLHSLKEVKI